MHIVQLSVSLTVPDQLVQFSACINYLLSLNDALLLFLQCSPLGQIKVYLITRSLITYLHPQPLANIKSQLNFSHLGNASQMYLHFRSQHPWHTKWKWALCRGLIVGLLILQSSHKNWSFASQCFTALASRGPDPLKPFFLSKAISIFITFSGAALNYWTHISHLLRCWMAGTQSVLCRATSWWERALKRSARRMLLCSSVILCCNLSGTSARSTVNGIANTFSCFCLFFMSWNLLPNADGEFCRLTQGRTRDKAQLLHLLPLHRPQR